MRTLIIVAIEFLALTAIVYLTDRAAYRHGRAEQRHADGLRIARLEHELSAARVKRAHRPESTPLLFARLELPPAIEVDLADLCAVPRVEVDDSDRGTS